MSKIYTNPFRWGMPIHGNHYIPRPAEQRQIAMAIEKQVHLVVSGYRGTGKTSLVKQVLSKIPRDSIYLNLSFVVSRGDLINHLLDALETSFPELKQDRDYKSLRACSPDSDLEPIFDMLYELAKQRGPKFTLAWDEFHHIAKLKDDVLAEMKKNISHRKGITHIFISHREDLLRDIFDDPLNPFFPHREFLIVNSLDEKAFNKFLTQRFRRMGLSDFDLAGKILKFTSGQPQLTQKFAHSLAQLWLVGTSTRLMERTLDKMLTEHHALFCSLWDNFGLNEKRLLLGLADGHSRPTELGFIAQYNLSATSTAHNTVLKLLRDGWLVSREEGYYIYDPLFLKWLQSTRESL